METPYRILIVEDDPVIAEQMQKRFQAWGFEAVCQEDFSRVLEGFERLQPHLVILDIGLPYFNGYYWCEKLRAVSQTPILFVSSREGNADIVMGMSLGGDDYITKPFDLDVLCSKVQAMLRRCYRYTGPQTSAFYRGALVQPEEARVTLNGQTAQLTTNEQRIFAMLLQHKGTVVSRDLLMLKLWDTDTFVDDNTLTVNVTRLRRKLEGIGLADCILTRKGEGYLLEDDA